MSVPPSLWGVLAKTHNTLKVQKIRNYNEKVFFSRKKQLHFLKLQLYHIGKAQNMPVVARLLVKKYCLLGLFKYLKVFNNLVNLEIVAMWYPFSVCTDALEVFWWVLCIAFFHYLLSDQKLSSKSRVGWITPVFSLLVQSVDFLSMNG